MSENPIKTPDTQTQEGKDAKKHSSGIKALNIAMEFGFITVIPLVAFGYLGKWLDQRYNHNFFAVLGILLALAITTLWFYRSIKRLMKDL